VLHGAHQLAVGDAVTPQLVGDQHPRHPALLLHQLGEELLGGPRIALALDEDVQDVALLVDRPPEVLSLAVDLDENLVQVPLVAGLGAAAAQLSGVGRAQLRAPLPDGLVRDDHTAGEPQLLDLPTGQK
jgi:hypothetical protein